MDDCITYVRKHKKIDKLTDSLKDEFLLEREDDMTNFLDLSIVKDDVKEKVTLSHLKKVL